MHDIRLIRDNPDSFDSGLRRRGLEPLSAELIALDDARKQATTTAQQILERKNRLSKEIGRAKSQGDEARFAELMRERDSLDRDMARAGTTVAEQRAKELDERLAEIPNIPNPEVPDGADETGNMVRHEWGKPPAISGPKQHFELAEAWKTVLGPAMDFEAAAKLSWDRTVAFFKKNLA